MNILDGQYLKLLGTLTLVVISILTCTEEDRSDPPFNGPRYTIANDNSRPRSKVDSLFSLRLILIDPSVADSIGGVGAKSDFFFIGDSLLLFADHMRNTVGAISLTGELKWQHRARPNDPQYFSSMHYVDVDLRTDRLVVSDLQKQSLFYYDYSGRFSGRDRLELFFSDRIAVGDSMWLYDLGGQYNTKIPAGDRLPKLVRWTGKTYEVLTTAPHPHPEEMNYDDQETFFQIQSEKYYQKNFSDSIFRVSSASLELSYLLDFESGERAQALLDDPNIINDYSVIFSRNIPHVHRAIRYRDRIYAVYEDNAVRRFAVVDKSGKNIANSDRLVIEGTVLPTPWNYWNGHFVTAMTDYTFDFLQQLPQYDFRTPQSVIDSFRQVEQERGYRAGGVIAILSLK